MDNSHMLSIMEQKMCADDRKVWTVDLEKEKETRYTTCVDDLDDWSPIRVGIHNQRTISHLRAYGDDNDQLPWYKCWLCKTSTHWSDQCQKFAALSIDERIKIAKANHVCFSCLKRARRDRRMDNCSRIRRCTKIENGTQCPHNHHQLLHRTSAIKIGIAMAINTKEAILSFLSANIISANSLFKLGNVLLDSGAQMETTETLGLNRKDTSVTITKVGGEEETIKTKEYKVQLASIDNDKRFTVKAFRIPTITTRSPQSRLHTYRTLLVHRIRNFAVTKDRSTFLSVLITHISMPVKRDKLIIC